MELFDNVNKTLKADLSDTLRVGSRVCSVGRRTWHGYHSSKKQGKKSVAYSMLCDILGLEEDDEA